MDHLEALVSASYAAKRLGVSIPLILSWKPEVKDVRSGRKLYRWGDLLDLERDKRRSPYGRPRSNAAA